MYEDGVECRPSMITGFQLHESPYAAVGLFDSSGSMEARFTFARSAGIRFLMDYARRTSRQFIDSIRRSNACRSFRVDEIWRQWLMRFGQEE